MKTQKGLLKIIITVLGVILLVVFYQTHLRYSYSIFRNGINGPLLEIRTDKLTGTMDARPVGDDGEWTIIYPKPKQAPQP